VLHSLTVRPYRCKYRTAESRPAATTLICHGARGGIALSAGPGQTTAMACPPADFIHPTRVPVGYALFDDAPDI
jgi:hypothetical protein